MNLLDSDQIRDSLKKLPESWEVIDDEVLVRTFEFNDFKSALAFVNKVGEIAESMNHHPDVRLSWGKVELSITTHSAGGLTANDFNLAEKISKL